MTHYATAANDAIEGRPNWHMDAACRGMGTEHFFDTGGKGGQPMQACWLVCEFCTVVDQCFDATMTAETGMGRELRSGLFAFSTPSERWRIAERLEVSNDRKSCGSVRGWQRHKLFGEEPCARCEARWRTYCDETDVHVEITGAVWRARKALSRKRKSA